MSQLSCRNLKIGYDNTAILNNISFDINEGDYLCIVGENGSGKSTLMKTILRLIPKLGGTITTDKDFKLKEIGYLPQQTQLQRDFPASVIEIVQSGCLNKCGLRPFYNKKEKQRAKANMERLGIASLMNKSYSELSGGQQQRVLLARALCATEKMLLLDEPVAGLDPKATEIMYELLNAINKSGITIIMITHDISAAIKYATHILDVSEAAVYCSKDEYTKMLKDKTNTTDEGENDNDRNNR